MSGTLLFPCEVCSKMTALSVHVCASVHPFLWAVGLRLSLLFDAGARERWRCFWMRHSPNAETVDGDFGKVWAK